MSSKTAVVNIEVFRNLIRLQQGKMKTKRLLDLQALNQLVTPHQGRGQEFSNRGTNFLNYVQ